MNFFKPEDFEQDNGFAATPINCAHIANAKLEREGKVMWHYDYEDKWQFVGDERHSTHKALLVNIEPIEKCQHPTNKLMGFIEWNKVREGEGLGFPIDKLKVMCECGAAIELTSFRGTEK